jgi:hypothetical protein
MKKLTTRPSSPVTPPLALTVEALRAIAGGATNADEMRTKR